MRTILLFVCLFFLVQCAPEKKLNTPSSGSIKIAVDESFKPFIESSTDVFETLNKKAKIRVVYKSEDAAVQELLQDSIEMVVISRELTSKEHAELKKNNVKATSVKIAIDAVALIAHPESPDSLLTMQRFEKIVRGTAKNKNGESVVLVFDNNFSSNLNYIRTYFKLTEKDSLKFYAAKSNADVISYVSKNQNTVGVIGANWVSDMDNTQQQGFLKKIRIIGLSEKENPTSVEEYFQPHPAYLQLKQYPLTREVYAIMRESRTGLATGFIAFLRGEKGQRIVLKEGLLPATIPTRIVEIKNEGSKSKEKD